MKYINQLEYPHVPYRTNVLNPNKSEADKMRTVSKSGCGLCCVCMTIDLLTDKTLEVEECVKISDEAIANHGCGTDMNILGPVIAEKFDIDYRSTSDVGEAISHIMRGGVAIAHVGVPLGKEQGLFTKGGHYILLVSTDERRFCILDPSYTPKKFTTPDRIGQVDVSRAPYLYCDVDTVNGEIKPNRIGYHLFSRKSV